MRKISWLALFLLVATAALAHVGSQDIYYEGNAGPYHLYVAVHMPQTIPGIATVEMRSATGGIREIHIAPMALLGSTKLSPVPDLVQRSKADPQFFTGNVWLMEASGFQVHIQADGDLGHGELGVPGTAMPQGILPMQPALGTVLFVLMLLLAAGLVSIMGASAREAQLEPGVVPTTTNVRRGWIAMAAAAVVVAVMLILGNLWWSADRRSHLMLTRPVRLRASLQGSRLVLDLPDGRVETRRGVFVDWQRFLGINLLIPDHNHLMHLFLVRSPNLDQFWHLHPTPDSRAWFSASLPSLPAGHYQLFADIVRITGAAPTLIGEIDLPEVKGSDLVGDDAGTAAPPVSAGQDRTVSELADGGRMIWERDPGPLKSRSFLSFCFRVEDEDGQPARDLEPYMDMAGHAEFIRSDFSAFAHVHPMGDVAMAAVQLADASLDANTPQLTASESSMSMHIPEVPETPAPPSEMQMPGARSGSEVSFPYGFPGPGTYRIFVQVKRRSHIETGIFDAHVE